MTTAALQAQCLRACLLDPHAGTDDLARRFFKAAAKPIDVAWQMATGGDLAIPSVPGKRTPATRALNAYLDRVQYAAERDIVVGHNFWRVAGFLDPPAALFAPAMLRRVFARRGPAAPASVKTGAEPAQTGRCLMTASRWCRSLPACPDLTDAASVRSVSGNSATGADWPVRRGGRCRASRGPTAAGCRRCGWTGAVRSPGSSDPRPPAGRHLELACGARAICVPKP